MGQRPEEKTKLFIPGCLDNAVLLRRSFKWSDVFKVACFSFNLDLFIWTFILTEGLTLK